MGKCVCCNKKGLFLRVDSRGLCRDCAPKLYLLEMNEIRIFNDCIKLINTSKNRETIGKRIILALEKLDNVTKMPIYFQSYFESKFSIKLQNMIEELNSKYTELTKPKNYNIDFIYESIKKQKRFGHEKNYEIFNYILNKDIESFENKLPEFEKILCPEELHSIYRNAFEMYYKLRNDDPINLQKAKVLAYKDINIWESDKLFGYNNLFSKNIIQLVKILTNENEFDKAIEICKFADYRGIESEFGDGWPGRINQVLKAKQKFESK